MHRKADLYVEILSSVHAIGNSRKRCAVGKFDGDSVNILATLEAVRELSGARVSDLAARLKVDLSVVSRRLTALERQGLLDREAHPGDGRAQLIKLSPKGRTLLEELRTQAGESITCGLRRWTAADLQSLASQLHRFERDLSQGQPGF
ncbi:MarR family winged helix-turn-helix transcriptional regulator [Streptomyces olivoreticuli]